MKNKTPAYYRAPLRSHSAILAFLKDGIPYCHHGLFGFNVKVHSLDLSFANLARIAKKNGELAADVSPRYLDACEAVFQEDDSDQLYDLALERAREGVTGDDTHRMLWDGKEAIAEWEFHGRSGGWLVLSEFENITFGRDFGLEELDSLPYPQLRRLYRFIVQCQHDFRREAVREQIEFEAAFNLFANVCANVETDMSKQPNGKPGSKRRPQSALIGRPGTR